MAISKVQGAIRAEIGADTITNNWLSTPTAGNLLVAIGKGTTVIGNAAMSGWSFAVSVLTGTTTTIGIWYKVAGASEGSAVLTWTSSTSTGLITEEWTGISAAVLDKVASTATTGSAVTSRSSGTTATTTANDELCIAGFGTGNFTSAQSFSNSFSDESSLDTSTIYMAALVVASTGTYETTMSWTTARVAGGIIATFKATPAATTKPWYAYAQQ